MQKQFVSDCIKSAKGSAQLNMSTEWLKEYPIPLPPLAEQQRIVDRIKSLFAKLDEAKEKAQAVVDSFETRKAAILHKAFTGELTAKWREEHGVGMESWHLRTIGEVCENVKVGIVIKPSQYYVPQNEGTPAFRSANVRECRIDDFDRGVIRRASMRYIKIEDLLVFRSRWGQGNELWKNSVLKKDFRDFFYNKCWYTEVLLVGQDVHIDHFRPKAAVKPFENFKVNSDYQPSFYHREGGFLRSDKKYLRNFPKTPPQTAPPIQSK